MIILKKFDKIIISSLDSSTTNLQVYKLSDKSLINLKSNHVRIVELIYI
jgi:hypothetical protein